MNPLFAVRDFIKLNQLVSDVQIAASLELPKPLVQQALEHWSRRGVILAEPASCSSGHSCSNCAAGGCHSPTGEFYRWNTTH
ncbi:FeoC-like transcriptional regulator [Celerinatantimonas sp. MCCC 1A17872]|uniref:FeoC-like transcriptional regulator n=1 Tax=Celerinatantimonas sp. MCCC 1A17872 TaxID=3177514 RepID=UPI0038CB62E9